MAWLTERASEIEHEIQIAESPYIHELQEYKLENRRRSFGKGLIQC